MAIIPITTSTDNQSDDQNATPKDRSSPQPLAPQKELESRRQAQQIPVEAFLFLFPDAFIQYFDDSEEKDMGKALSTPHFDPVQAEQKQRAGCGVFFSPNGFQQARKSECLHQIQALYVDLDCAKEGDGTSLAALEGRKVDALHSLQSFPLKPHTVIETKNGLQAVWRIVPLPRENLDLFEQAEDLLIRHFRADPAAKDVTRVLRLPGFLHQKDPARPFLCRFLWCDSITAPHSLPDLVSVLLALDVFSWGNDAERDERTTAITPAEKKWEAGADGVATGQRNATAASVAGKLLSVLPRKLWETCGWGGLKQWNEKNLKPLPESELRSVFQSIARAEIAHAETKRDEVPRRIPQAERVLSLVTDENCTLFHDQFREPHARVLVEGHWETWKTKSREFHRWLGKLFWDSAGSAVTADAICTALNVLDAKAVYNGPQITLENRVGWRDGAIWYDLCDRRWRAVKIRTDGWEVVECPPILFRRFSHQAAQLVPTKGGKLETLLPYVNLADERQGVLLLAYIVSCFLPDIPHPIPNLHGPQGAAKTTLARMLRRIVDPSKVEVLSFPSGSAELVQQLSHHYFAFFDNISDVSEGISDLLCRAVTGEGFSKRELYTDDEDIIYTFRRCIGLNGINPAAKKPDLLDRSILLKLDRIPEDRRREERDVLAAFDAERPAILGAIFDALSAAMRLHESVRLSRLPRMADFARWGAAITQALGYRPEEFLSAYSANIVEQHEEAIQENPVAAAVRAFMEGRPDGWEGSMSELLESLSNVAKLEKIDTDAKLWPKAANALSRRLNEAKTNLAEVGIIFERMAAEKGKRMIVIRAMREDMTLNEPSAVSHATRREEDNTGDETISPQISSSPFPQGRAEKDDTNDLNDISGGIAGLTSLGFFS